MGEPCGKQVWYFGDACTLRVKSRYDVDAIVRGKRLDCSLSLSFLMSWY